MLSGPNSGSFQEGTSKHWPCQRPTQRQAWPAGDRAWFNSRIFAGDKSGVAGVELATASGPQRASLGSGGVALGRRPQPPLSCDLRLNHARKEIKRPDLTLCKAGCYVKTTGHSKPATYENRVSLLGRDDSPERPGTPISPAFSTVHLISISKLGFVQALSCNGLVTSLGLCDRRRRRAKTAKPELF